ncbi:MAG: Ig-like domain-containing protein [bacterium]|nr:Ig-like domain-containing protein [bacterium]
MKQKTIPTLLALLIIVGGLVAGTILTQGVQFLTSRASPPHKPSSVKLTNLSDRSISIAWTTDADTTGFIRYGKTKERMETTALDDARSQTAGTTHHITLKNLEAGTAYFYGIGANDEVVDNNGTPFTFTTAPPLAESPPQRPILQGKILGVDGKGVEGSLVFLTLDATTLSALTSASGRWSIPLTDKRTADGRAFLSFPPKQNPVDIFVQTGKGDSASATWNVTFADDTTVPDIKLGEEQKFGDAGAARQADVTVNLRDNDKLATSSPTFSGTGKAGDSLTVTVESDNPQTATIIVNPDGSWNFTPSAQLTPGQHTLTIRTPSGETITRTFTVAGTAPSPSPLPAPSPSPTPSPTPKPSPSPTPRPTPSATPSATTVPVGGGLPDTASFNPIAWMLLLGIILVGGGLVSSFRSQPSSR